MATSPNLKTMITQFKCSKRSLEKIKYRICHHFKQSSTYVHHCNNWLPIGCPHCWLRNEGNFFFPWRKLDPEVGSTDKHSEWGVLLPQTAISWQEFCNRQASYALYFLNFLNCNLFSNSSRTSYSSICFVLLENKEGFCK